MMGGRGVRAAAHFGQAHLQSRLGQLPRGFRARQPAADHMNVIGHRDALNPDGPGWKDLAREARLPKSVT